MITSHVRNQYFLLRVILQARCRNTLAERLFGDQFPITTTLMVKHETRWCNLNARISILSFTKWNKFSFNAPFLIYYVFCIPCGYQLTREIVPIIRKAIHFRDANKIITILREIRCSPTLCPVSSQMEIMA